MEFLLPEQIKLFTIRVFFNTRNNLKFPLDVEICTIVKFNTYNNNK